MHHVIEARHGNPPGGDRLFERPAEVLLARHLYVETGVRGFIGGVCAVPIGNDEARKMPGAL